MKALRLALALIRIPRLFAYLFLLPLLLSLVLVYMQLIFTGVFVKGVHKGSEAVQERVVESKENNVLRLLLYGDGAPLPAVRICRWTQRYDEQGELVEDPPVQEDCEPDRLDIAIVENLDKPVDIDEYIRIFDGNVERIHLCQFCRPDALIDARGEKLESHARSILGIGILNLVLMNSDVQNQYVKAAQQYDKVTDLIGEKFLHADGFREPISFSGLSTTIAIVLNNAFLIIMTLWLALKAHRKILDYFGRSGALLPMVAASGKKSFYGAIWILTLARVSVFLLAAIPVTIFGLSQIFESGDIDRFIGGDYLTFSLWLLAIFASLSLATVIASIAELKHRHALLSFSYRYLPFIISMLGAAFWCLTFVLDTPAFSFAHIRAVVSLIPIIGIIPILLGPIFKPALFVLITHVVLSSALLFFILRSNSRWFAAHLEEI